MGTVQFLEKAEVTFPGGEKQRISNVRAMLKDTREEQGDVFAEVSLEPAPILLVEKIERSEILIVWKDFSISVTDQHETTMVAELLIRLEKQC
jgi:hypothetical protein